MPSLTRSCSFNCRLLVALVAFGSLTSSCQSSRPGFSFQPIVLRLAAPAPTAAIAPNTVSEAAASAVEMTTAALAPAPPIVQAAPAPPANASLAALPAPAVAQLRPVLATAPAAAATAAVQSRADARVRRHARHRAQAPAEAGLGLTVLGLLGMVVLVVALVGLAISGGGVGWIITAAIAAGVVLLAYLDPHGR